MTKLSTKNRQRSLPRCFAVLVIICLVLHGSVTQGGDAFLSPRLVPNNQKAVRTASTTSSDFIHLLPIATTSRQVPTSASALHATTENSSSTTNAAVFEYQELNSLLKAMKDQNVKSWQLGADKRVEMEGYVRRIVNRRDGLPLNQLRDALPHTKWRLVFSTEQMMSQALPKDATLKLQFLDETMVDYCLEFSKTLGLKRLVAKSSYIVDVSLTLILSDVGQLQYLSSAPHLTMDIPFISHNSSIVDTCESWPGEHSIRVYYDRRFWTKKCWGGDVWHVER
jgi:hypothetical protein